MQEKLQLNGVSVRLNTAVTDTDVAGFALTAAERARIARLHNVAARAKLSNALKWERRALELLASPLVLGEMALGKTEAGIPFFVGHAELGVSISRSESASMVGVSTVGPVGVDIERVRPLAYEPMLGMVATETERACVANGVVSERFFRLWTLKEAVLKALGVGLAGGALSVCVPDQMIEADGCALFSVGHVDFEASVASGDGAVAAVAVRR